MVKNHEFLFDLDLDNYTCPSFSHSLQHSSILSPQLQAKDISLAFYCVIIDVSSLFTRLLESVFFLWDAVFCYRRHPAGGSKPEIGPGHDGAWKMIPGSGLFLIGISGFLIFYAVLAHLSARMGEGLRLPPYYRIYYFAVLFLILAALYGW